MYKKNQNYLEPIDVADWRPSPEFEVYPVGAREKRLLYCPENNSFRFLMANHQYLFKYSSHRYPEQYWIEIFSYRLGEILCLPVPPAFVAFNSSDGTSGALIEWFYEYKDEYSEEMVRWANSLRKKKTQGKSKMEIFMHFIKSFGIDDQIKGMMEGSERFVPGGDIMQRMILGFDRKKGRQHNFGSISTWFVALERSEAYNFSENWYKCWSQMLLFDALIGNSDRHQENWGVIWKWISGEKLIPMLAPIFDNGSSMGHEIILDNFFKFEDSAYLERYINKGKHHLKWEKDDSQKIGHVELLKKLISRNKESKDYMVEVLERFSMEKIDEVFYELTKFSVPIPLSRERAEFMKKLLKFRYQKINEELGI